MRTRGASSRLGSRWCSSRPSPSGAPSTSMRVGTRGTRRAMRPQIVCACGFRSHQAGRNALGSRFTNSSRALMEVQIFGVKKSADTRKSIRFFAERRIRAHFVDLVERPLAEGELQRFAQKFGIDALVDRESKRFEELGLKYAQSSPSRWTDRLLAEPTLLRLPLVRRLGQPQGLTVGVDENAWKEWT